MNRVKFYLKNNDGTKKSIVAHVFFDTKNPRLYYYTGEAIEPGQWDNEKQRARIRGSNKAPGASALNIYLDSVESELLSFIREAKAENPGASYPLIKQLFERKFKKYEEKTFAGYFEDFLKIERGNIAYGTYKSREALLKKLINFEKVTRYRLSFSTINRFFWEKFYSYLTDIERLRASTCKQYLDTLKLFMNWTFERGLHTNLEFKKFSLSVPSKEITFLEPDELQRVIDLDLSETPDLDSTRDLFVFGCFTGARYSDISTLRREDIKGNVWNLRTHKTNDLLSIPLNPVAMQLLDKYHGSPTPLPVLRIQKAISGIKQVCKLAKIDTPVTTSKYIGNQRTDETRPKYALIGTHTARRTFVTLSIMQGMKPETVMKITGHSDYKTMQKYLNITNKEAHKEYLKIWGDPNLTLVNSK